MWIIDRLFRRAFGWPVDTAWEVYVPLATAFPTMRRRFRGKWEYRELTDEEWGDYASQDAW
jgi:hypothetical protein